MKKIFLKQYNALFDAPYEEALPSRTEIIGEHHFEDGKIYEEGVDFFLKEIGGLFDDGEGFETEVAIPID